MLPQVGVGTRLVDGKRRVFSWLWQLDPSISGKIAVRVQKSFVKLMFFVAMCLASAVAIAAPGRELATRTLSTSGQRVVAAVISAPINCAQVEGTVIFSVAGQSGRVSSISYYVDGKYLASTPPFSILWDSTSVADGPHLLSVQAFDRFRHLLADPIVLVTVNNSSALPSQSLPPIADPIRPSNDIPNCRIPTAAELAAFHSGTGGCGNLDDCNYMQKVDGQFAGTTEQIIELAADKWCPSCTIVNPLDGQTYSFVDLLKAVAVNESFWHQWLSAKLARPNPITQTTMLTPKHDDRVHVTKSEPNGGSWGVFQIAEGINQGWPAAFPLSAISTAFNADFKIAEQMGVEQGHLDYLNDPSFAKIAIAHGHAPYADYTDAHGVLHKASTDPNERRWGAVGNWFSGGWYDSGAIRYIWQVQQYLHDQTWTQSGF